MTDFKKCASLNHHVVARRRLEDHKEFRVEVDCTSPAVALQE